ncbi:hypothetical protein Tco_1116565, partial [Tanacetum coccineum]
ISSVESKVHIEVLSALWENKLPFPVGAFPMTRKFTGSGRLIPDLSVFKKVKECGADKSGRFAPDVSVFKKAEEVPKVEKRPLDLVGSFLMFQSFKGP